jgi:hypothetical protein
MRRRPELPPHASHQRDHLWHEVPEKNYRTFDKFLDAPLAREERHREGARDWMLKTHERGGEAFNLALS